MPPLPDKTSSLFPSLGFGLGLRPKHYADILEGRSSVSWFEVISENYMGDGGRPLYLLEKVRQDFPIALHGVSLSIGSTDPLNRDYLKKLKSIIHRFDPAIVSDHCCWTGMNGQNLHDLMPLPYTREAVKHLSKRIQKVQDFLGRRILLENVSSYVSFAHSEMTEWEFLSELSADSDCGLLLDINNVYVSSVNHGTNPSEFIKGLPRDRVGQMHLAGHTTRENPNGSVLLIDTHDHPVCEEVWDLYREAVSHFYSTSTMVEWDADIPDYAVLAAEIGKAQTIHGKIKETVIDPEYTPGRAFPRGSAKLDAENRHRS